MPWTAQGATVRSRAATAALVFVLLVPAGLTESREGMASARTPGSASAAPASGSAVRGSAERHLDSWGSSALSEAPLTADERSVLSGLPPDARIAFHAETGRVRFLAAAPDRPLARAADLRPTALRLGPTTKAFGARILMPEAMARAFLVRVGGAFGLADQGSELQVERTRPAGSRSFVRFGQIRDGVPVLGGELIVQIDGTGDVISTNGEVLPASDPVDTRPQIDVATARSIATAAVARDARVARSQLAATDRGRYVFDRRIMGGPGWPFPRLVWGVDVRGPSTLGATPVAKSVYVDAGNGAIALSINLVEAALDRRICDFRNVRKQDFRCHGAYVRTEGQPAIGRHDVDQAYANIRRMYEFYMSWFGRDSLDGKGERLIATVRYCRPTSCPMQNAFWEWQPQQVAFGAGWAKVDDVVAHEYTHGVQDHEDRLFYHYQSGAINESLADTFGEFVDLTDGFGDDRSAVRWLIGEELGIGAVRDMRDPTRYGDPDRVRSFRYWDTTYDEGGVHINSGIPNKTVALITDGGTFNGRTIRALGLTRAIYVYYELMTNLLTSASDFNDMYDLLPQACLDLVGQHTIRHSDCQQVREAVSATEMDLQPASVDARPLEAPTCGPGKAPDTTWFDNLEHPAAGYWKRQILAGHKQTWYYPQNPNSDPKWDATWASSGKLNFFGDDKRVVTDAAIAMTQDITIPAKAFLRFEHGFRFDYSGHVRYDGGVVEYKIAGDFWRDAGALFTNSHYNGRIARGHGNPLRGRRAFTAESHGWGATRLDLSGLAGKKVRFRFRTGTDNKIDDYGWYIDDVHIYRCVADSAAPSATLTLAGGSAITVNESVNVRIDAADAGSGLSRLRLSNTGETQNGLLSKSIDMPYADLVRWSLTDTTFGGDASDGQHSVFAQVRDGAGNWSGVASADIVLDSVPPAVGVPSVGFTVPSSVDATAPRVPVRVTWTATDATTGLAATELQRTLNDGTWDGVALDGPTDTQQVVLVGDDPSIVRRFRDRATDVAGNMSEWAAGPDFRVDPIQESDVGWTFAGGWTKRSNTDFYGDGARSTDNADATATLDFTATDVALVLARGPDRGIATVSVDGGPVDTLDLYATSDQLRRIVWAHPFASGGPHTLAIRVTGNKNAASSAATVLVDAALLLTT